MKILTVHPESFLGCLEAAREGSWRIAAATTPADELRVHGALTRLSDDGLSGYAVQPDGELVGVFSLVRGRGDELVTDAIANGATHLDCFDGYLVDFYRRHGFGVHRREANWNPGGPDVVYMYLGDD